MSNVTYLPGAGTPFDQASEPLWGEPVRILAPVREPLLKPAQAAEQLGCTIPELHGRRDVEAFRVGSRWRYRLLGSPAAESNGALRGRSSQSGSTGQGPDANPNPKEGACAT